MGIKCFCPHGHSLHLKSHLAGKRGVCPKCGATFQIPATTVAAGPLEGASPPAAPSQVPPDFAEPGQGGGASDPDDRPGDEPAAGEVRPSIWYVRTRDGQHGPTNEAAVRDWVADGRVAPDSWVWRDGWPEWRPAKSVFPQLQAGPLPSAPATESQPSLDRTFATPAVVGRAMLRQRREAKRRRLFVLCLMVVSLILLVALAVVIL